MARSVKKVVGVPTAIDWLDLHSKLLGGIRGSLNSDAVREAVMRLIPDANPFGVSDSAIDFVIQNFSYYGDEGVQESVSKLRELSGYDRRLLVRHICNSFFLENKVRPHGEEVAQ